MALWRKNMQIPQSVRKRKKEERKEKKENSFNSFYVYCTGKTPEEYIETPENRRVAGINIEQE